MRPSNRQTNQMRPISIECNVNPYAEGSALIKLGNTHVLCTASVEERLPPFLRGKNQGWVTAEYAMLPRATHERSTREASRGKQTGRTIEIQRLIGRSLRAAIDLKALGERAITIDCDVLQADGGTRTAAINGGFVALAQAIRHLIQNGKLTTNPLTTQVAAISVGIYQNTPILDLDYSEDSSAETDMNIIMNDQQHLIEIQGTAEGQAFSRLQMNQMIDLGESGIAQILTVQKQALGLL
ncbi:ribonuclease PH [Rappaport israeli]|uniref:ribonuclease PH n=1 Tax=Rappaport israeli TaxID=1839807 RepID=UPI0009304A86|nr:ribonuclease PH [Rappaport israeli]